MNFIINNSHELIGDYYVISRCGENNSNVFVVTITNQLLLDKWCFIEFEKSDGSKYITPQLDIVDGVVTYTLVNGLCNGTSFLKAQFIFRNASNFSWKTYIKQFLVSESLNVDDNYPIEYPDFIANAQTILDNVEVVEQEMEDRVTDCETNVAECEQTIADYTAAESTRQENEIIRQANEDNRGTSETERIANEDTRQANEVTRTTNEINRSSNEEDRIDAETSRTQAETIRDDNETIRISNEETRVSNETTRVDAETIRVNAETGRANAETIRVNAETTRVNNESTRQTNESTRQINETNRGNNETTRLSNETTRQTNESTRQSNEQTRQANEITRQTQEADREIAMVEFEAEVNAAIENKANIDGYYAQLGVGTANNMIPEKAAEYTETFDESGETAGGSNTVTDGVMKVLQANGNTDGNGVTNAISVLGESIVVDETIKSVNLSAINTTGTEQSSQGTITLTTPVELRSVGTIKDELISYDATLGTAKVLRKTGKYTFTGTETGGSNLGTYPASSFYMSLHLSENAKITTYLNDNSLFKREYNINYTYFSGVRTMIISCLVAYNSFAEMFADIFANNEMVYEIATPVVETISVTSTITDKTQILAANITNSNSDYVQGEVVLKQKLISANIHNLYASGDNQFTGTNWVSGYYNTSNGTTLISHTSFKVCTDFIQVVGGKTYKYCDNTGITYGMWYEYDVNKNYLGFYEGSSILRTWRVNTCYIRRAQTSAIPTKTFLWLPWSDWTTKTIADWVAPNTQTLALNYVGNKVGTYYDYLDFKLMKNHKVIDKVAFTPELVLSQPNNLYDGDYIYYPKTTEVIEDIPITTPNSIIVRDHGILYFDAPTGEDSATITFLNGYGDDIKKNSVNNYQQFEAFITALATKLGYTITFTPNGNGWNCTIV